MMKSIRRCWIAITLCAAILMLCSCTKNEAAPKETAAPAAAAQAGSTAAGDTAEGVYAFSSGDVTIAMKADMSELLKALGEAEGYAESPSCAFEGIDKIYSYHGFDVYTYPDGDKDYVSSVYLTDDSVKTPEGIGVGDSVEDMIKAYGEDYTEEFDTYTYEKDGVRLQFLTDGEKIEAIEYIAVMDLK